MEEFKNHIKMIKDRGIKFVNPSNFEDELNNNKLERKVLLTIDDGYESFYKKCLANIKKRFSNPFILFVSTREVGKKGYMSWENIKEIEKYDFVEIEITVILMTILLILQIMR